MLDHRIPNLQIIDIAAIIAVNVIIIGDEF